jgi:AbiV family abortive infection protein
VEPDDEGDPRGHHLDDRDQRLRSDTIEYREGLAQTSESELREHFLQEGRLSSTAVEKTWEGRVLSRRPIKLARVTDEDIPMAAALKTFAQDVEQRRKACFLHASDLIRAAEQLQAENLPHISYHLATLALEEIGKAELIVMQGLSIARGEEASWISRYLESHTKKLFITFLGPQFGRSPITGDRLRELEAAAVAAHSLRLKGLYVDASDEQAPPPRAAITPENAKTTIHFAKATLHLAQHRRFEPLSDEEEENVLWFFEAVEDPEKRKLILGGPSLRKMAEVENGQAWIRWVREQFDQAEQEGIARVQQELARPIPGDDEAFSEKWRIQVRIFSDSHSIRAKVLQEWSQQITWFKLIYVQKKNQFIAEITLPKKVHIAALYDAGFSAVQDFVLALNIGSAGFFWWYLPEYTSRFYESAKDLESGTNVVVERTPKLRVDWKGGVLDQRILHNVKACFAALASGDFPKQNSPFGLYFSGLALLAKNDVLLRLEATTYEQFFRALQLGMQSFGDWNMEEPFKESFGRMFGQLLGENPGDEWVDWGEAILGGHPPENITLSEVAGMKVLCDLYFRHALERDLRRRSGESYEESD